MSSSRGRGIHKEEERGETRRRGVDMMCASMCEIMCDMATNLALDDRLLEEALRVGGRRTKKETVTEALVEFIQRRKQTRIRDLFGTVDYDPKYDYKKQRRRP
jgi:hypothetical protein